MSVVRSLGDVYAPRFFLEADGVLANDLIPLCMKFEFEEEEKKLPKLTLTFANPNMKLLDDPRFEEGVKFRVRFGYLNDMSDIKVATIAHARPHYGAGMPTMEMIAMNLQGMNKAANSVNWGAISSSDVAKKIAAKHGYKTEIEDSKDGRRQSRVQPAAVTDLQYLMGLAKPLHWDCYLDKDTLHFHPIAYTGTASLEFTYFTDRMGTLIKFSPDVNMTAPPAVKTASSDPKHGEGQTEGRRDVGAGEERRKGYSTKAAFGMDYIVTPTPETEPHVVAAHGEAGAKKIDMKAIKSTAEMIGTPRLAARTMIRIAGVDKIYTGNWRVTKAKHTIDTHGYRTSVNMSRDAGKAKTPEQNKHDTEGHGGDEGPGNRTRGYATKSALGNVFSK